MKYSLKRLLGGQFAIVLCLGFLLFSAFSANAQTISNVAPDSAEYGSTVNITITGMGTNFQVGTTTLMMGSTSYFSSSDVVNSATEVVSTVSIPANAPTGWYDVDKDGITAAASFWIGPCVGSCGSISGTVWDDTNNNGIQDLGEGALSGFTVTLVQTGETSTTDANGDYSFYTETGVTYTVSIDAGVYNAPCWTTGSVNGVVNAPVSGTHSVTLTGGSPNSTGNDFGLGIPSTACQIVDIDPDSVLQGSSFTATITGLGTMFMAGSTSITLGGNTYMGTNETIISDTEYTVDFALPANSPFGAYDFTKDNITAPASFHIVPCTNCGVISGTVWNDENGNGIQDVTENGQPGIDVSISPLGFVSTSDASGNYSFSVPPTQTYTVTAANVTYTASCWDGVQQSSTESYPGSGHSITLSVANPDSIGADFGMVMPDSSCQIIDIAPDTILVNTTVDLNMTGIGTIFQSGSTTLYDGTTTIQFNTETITSNTDYTANFTIPANATVGWYTLEKQGIIVPNAVYIASCIGTCGEISGMVWNDENGNGIMDGSEQPMPGMSITADPGGFGAVTDASGNYLFTVPDTTVYTVTMDAGTYTANCSGTVQLPGSQSTPVGPFSIPLNQGTSTSANNDFGLVIPDTVCGTIEGHAYVDANGNGVEDGGEADWTAAEVRLMPNNITVTVDASGNYSFDVLKDSVYTVEVTNTTMPLNCAATTQNYPVTISQPVAGTYTQTVTTAAPSSLGNDFGGDFPVACADFSGVVFEDENSNGVMDGAEVGVSAAWVRNLTTLEWIQTDGSGNWQSTGHYDTNYEFSLWLAGNNYGCNGSNVGPTLQTLPAANGNITSQVVSGNTASTGLDFGQATPTSACGILEGIVYDDLNGNGTQDGGEPGIAFTQITVTGGGSTCIGYTDANGNYSMQVPPGNTYTVSVNAVSYGYTYFCTLGYVANTATITEPAATTYSASPATGMLEVTGLDFGINYSQSQNVADARLVGLWMTAGNTPDETFNAGTDFKINVTSGIANCTLRINRDPLVDFVGMQSVWWAGPAPDVVTADANLWYLNGLTPGLHAWCLQQIYHIDASVPPGSYLEWEGEVWCDAVDPCPSNNYKSRQVFVYNNRSSVVPDINGMDIDHQGDSLSNDILQADSSFSYTISYQNVTGETVHTLTILDTLPPELDPTTVSQPFSLHKHEFYIVDNVLHFEFDSIMLADTSDSRINSYGFVQYDVKMYPNLPVGTEIHNDATLLFNEDDPIPVQAPVVQIVEPDGVGDQWVIKGDIRVFPNPARDVLKIVHTDGQLYNVELLDMLGHAVRTQQTNGAVAITFGTGDLAPGMYVLRLNDGITIQTRTVIIQR